MKAYFFTENQLARIIGMGIQLWQNENFSYSRRTMQEMAESIIADCNLEGAQKPILLNDVSEITSHCTFYPQEDIVGFTGKDGVLSGVFIKEN